MTETYCLAALFVLERLADPQGCVEGIARRDLADEAGMSPRQWSRAIAALQATGRLEYAPGVGTQHSYYKIVELTSSPLQTISTGLSVNTPAISTGLSVNTPRLSVPSAASRDSIARLRERDSMRLHGRAIEAASQQASLVRVQSLPTPVTGRSSLEDIRELTARARREGWA